MKMKENLQKKIDSKQIVITENNMGQRIDNFLVRYFGKVPNSRIYQMLRRGEVRVNRGRIKPHYKLKINDVIRIPPVFINEKQSLKPNRSLQKTILDSIIFEDEGIVVINKPSGIVVHSGSRQSHGVIEAFRAVGSEYQSLELAHRLDKDTSGCLILAKNIPTLRKLQKSLQDKKSIKTYTALLSGKMVKIKKIIKSPLKKNIVSSGEHMVTIDKFGKSASTVFFRERMFKDTTLVKIELMTGRTHQIRVHSASTGNFIVGDKKYGDRSVNNKFRNLGLKRMFLHAKSLNFISPITKKRLIIEADLGRDLVDFLKRLD